jgi:transposase
MAMLADLVDVVIGVDTHKHTHTAAVVIAATGAVVEQVTVRATPAGYRRLLELAGAHQGQRVWAIESTGGYGAGLTRFLSAHHEQVVELDRPKRTARRHGAKSDPIDATRAAREALGRDRLAQPWRCGWRQGARRSKPPPTPNASSRPWWSLPPRPSADGCAT